MNDNRRSSNGGRPAAPASQEEFTMDRSVVACLSALGVAACAAGAVAAEPPARDGETVPLPVGAQDDLRRTAVVRAVERVSPAVVNIATDRIVRRPYIGWDDFFGRVGGGGRQFRTQSIGSGVLIDPDGWILTNSHVVSQGVEIHVKFGGAGTAGAEEGIIARAVATDPTSDLALLKIEGGPFPYVEFGNSADLMIGEPAITIGNPFGFSSTVTTGVISALGRNVTLPTGFLDEVTQIEGMIQTDATIDPGNSGGPLLDIHGRLVGINTAVLPQARGIGLAIPVDRVKHALESLLDPVRGNATWYGFECRGGAGGLHVDLVDPAGPAAAAGVRVGDRVVSVDGEAVRSVLGIERRLVANAKRVKLVLRRAAGETTVEFAAAEHPGLRRARERFGVGLEPFEWDLEGSTRVGFVVKTLREASAAAEIGLRVDDVLEAVSGVPLTGARAVEGAVRAAPAGKPIPVRFARRLANGRWVHNEVAAVLE
jgi:serine protease Do